MSKCPKDKYGFHNPIQFHDYPDAVVEGCKICNKKLIYYKRNGKINDAEYYSDHIRDFAQPHGSTAKIFERVYGRAGQRAVQQNKSFLQSVKSKDKIQSEWEETLKDAKREMRAMDDYGKSTISSGI